jgi:hypothetical protein
MSDQVFQIAYRAVRKSYSNEAWGTLTPRQITEEIYREIRRIDAGGQVSDSDIVQSEARPRREP